MHHQVEASNHLIIAAKSSEFYNVLDSQSLRQPPYFLIVFVFAKQRSADDHKPRVRKPLENTLRGGLQKNMLALPGRDSPN